MIFSLILINFSHKHFIHKVDIILKHGGGNFAGEKS